MRIPTRFDRYSFDDVKDRFILTESQVQFLKNEQGIAAETLLEITPQIGKEMEFIQQHAYYKARIDFVDYIIDMSNNFMTSSGDSNGNI